MPEATDLSAAPSAALAALRDRWLAAWPRALACWSPFTRLSAPRLCLTPAEEQAEKLTGSFAMIRLTDHAVVIGLAEIGARGLAGYAPEILAHEIGHHVYAPGDLRDNARLLARMRRALPGLGHLAGLASNLYTDLLINDRLQRQHGLRMAEVFLRMQAGAPPPTAVWKLYLRIYEQLWSLPSHSLCPPHPDGKTAAAIEGDARLGARLIRVYARDFVAGASRFGVLFLPYFQQMKKEDQVAWLDALLAGEGTLLPEGLTSLDDDELDDPLHPAEDPLISGVPLGAGAGASRGNPVSAADARPARERSPADYAALLKTLGVQLSPQQIVCAYYRERSAPYLIRYPARPARRTEDPQPEGLDVWDVGSPLSAIDWVQTLMRGPLIPGYSTVERQYGATEGQGAARRPPDLFLGVDCSGSMPNPANVHSWPVLAGTVILRSALRAGAHVMVTLSGESPGRWSSTGAFLRDEQTVLNTLTSYLGTGYAFGILRLKDAFIDAAPPRETHILIVTDSDLFTMLDRTPEGWEIAEAALKRAGAGGTLALNLNPAYHDKPIARLKGMGWEVHPVFGQPELLAFARAFSKRKYEP